MDILEQLEKRLYHNSVFLLDRKFMNPKKKKVGFRLSLISFIWGWEKKEKSFYQ